MVELEVESSVGEGEFVVDMPPENKTNYKTSISAIPQKTNKFNGIKGRFLMNSPSVEIGTKTRLIFIGNYKGEEVTIKYLDAIVERISDESIDLRIIFNYSCIFKGNKIFFRRLKLVNVIKVYNGKKLSYTY